MLRAAAMTYVAGAASAAAYILYLALMGGVRCSEKRRRLRRRGYRKQFSGTGQQRTFNLD